MSGQEQWCNDPFHSISIDGGYQRLHIASTLLQSNIRLDTLLLIFLLVDWNNVEGKINVIASIWHGYSKRKMDREREKMKRITIA